MANMSLLEPLFSQEKLILQFALKRQLEINNGSIKAHATNEPITSC